MLLVVLTGGRDRRLNNDNDQYNKSDNNLDDRIAKFYDLIGTNNVYRTPFRCLIDLGLVNFPIKFDTKFVFTLKQNLSKLSELHKKVRSQHSNNFPRCSLHKATAIETY